jgi:acid phosphatase
LCLLLGAALGCGGGASSPQTTPKAQSPSITLTAQPDTIASGSSSALQWSASNTTSVTVKGLGTFAASGSVTVTPTATTTYTATATGPGGTASASTTVTITTAPPPVVPVFSHVFVVVEENHGYSSVIGSSSMPYLNSLANQHGLATQFYANTHPSIGNYFMMTAGQIITNNDSYNTTVTADNIVRHFLTAGKTWKSYAESLPSVGYTGWDVYPYVKHHNPFAYFSDVVNSSNQKNYLVPFSQFATDLKNNQLPQFSFIIPNQKNNAHDGTLNQADAWLKTNLAPLISNSAFSQNGLLIILFDEADTADSNHGGGHIAMLVLSPKAKKAYKSTTFYQHQSALRLMLQGLGVTSYPGAAGSAPSMTEFF